MRYRDGPSNRLGRVLVVLSPAKSLDYETPPRTDKFTEPALLEHSAELVEIMAQKSPRQLQNLMGISAPLAELNVERFRSWDLPFTPETARQAILAFTGDVYQGLDVATFSSRDFTRAQRSIRILSGLYGVLAPLDLMMPYRLEMGTKLKTGRGNTLYEFWGERVTGEINVAVRQSPGRKVLINLASNEYFKAVKVDKLDAPVVTPAFLDAKGAGDYKTVSFFAKRARGAMAAWMVKNRAGSPDELMEFDGLGYAFSADRSTDDRLVFTRRNSS